MSAIVVHPSLSPVGVGIELEGNKIYAISECCLARLGVSTVDPSEYSGTVRGPKFGPRSSRCSECTRVYRGYLDLFLVLPSDCSIRAVIIWIHAWTEISEDRIVVEFW